MRILVTGASGSGTTTLAHALAERLGIAHFDGDDYFWLPTNPPFTHKRDAKDRLQSLSADLSYHESSVLSGSVMGWGAELDDSFSLVVFLTLDAEIRVERLRLREIARFGAADPEFLRWAAQYEEGLPPGRSRKMHEEWLSARKHPVLRIDGNSSVEQRISLVMSCIAKNRIVRVQDL